jgi:hypothetical protein
MAKRTDIHRPSNPDFDPQEYKYIAAFDLAWHPSIETAMAAAIRGLWRQEILVDLIKNHQAKWAEHVTAQSMKCGHCGTRVVYVALLLHEPTNELIEVGEICLGNRFSLSANQFKSLREASAQRRAESKNAEKRAALLEEHPELVAAMESDNSFIKDVMRKFKRYAELSDRQIAAVKTALIRDAEWEVKKAAEQKEMESAKDAPSGRIEITGEILSIKYRDSFYGGGFKITIKTTDGWKLWVSRPSALKEVEVGDTVSMTAMVTPSNDDPKFAFGKRPSKAVLVS